MLQRIVPRGHRVSPQRVVPILAEDDDLTYRTVEAIACHANELGCPVNPHILLVLGVHGSQAVLEDRLDRVEETLEVHIHL